MSLSASGDRLHVPFRRSLAESHEPRRPYKQKRPLPLLSARSFSSKFRYSFPYYTPPSVICQVYLQISLSQAKHGRYYSSIAYHYLYVGISGDVHLLQFQEDIGVYFRRIRIDDNLEFRLRSFVHRNIERSMEVEVSYRYSLAVSSPARIIRSLIFPSTGTPMLSTWIQLIP